MKKETLIAVRLDQLQLERLNAWRRTQLDPPTRAEAVRRLMELGLTAEEAKAKKKG